jgi:hypothetical protein
MMFFRFENKKGKIQYGKLQETLQDDGGRVYEFDLFNSNKNLYFLNVPPKRTLVHQDLKFRFLHMDPDGHPYDEEEKLAAAKFLVKGTKLQKISMGSGILFHYLDQYGVQQQGKLYFYLTENCERLYNFENIRLPGQGYFTLIAPHERVVYKGLGKYEIIIHDAKDRSLDEQEQRDVAQILAEKLIGRPTKLTKVVEEEVISNTAPTGPGMR